METAAPTAERAPLSERAASARDLIERRPTEVGAIQKAIEDVNQIIETLRGALDDMEEVLETLEVVERQKNADEQEIEELRRALRPLRRPREVPRDGH